MLAMKIFEPRQTEWAAPNVVERKEDGTLRLCVDDFELNAVTIRDSYFYTAWTSAPAPSEMPRIFQHWTTIVCNWKVEVADEACKIAAFTSHYGLLRYIQVPIGFKTRPRRFTERWT